MVSDSVVWGMGLDSLSGIGFLSDRGMGLDSLSGIGFLSGVVAVFSRNSRRIRPAHNLVEKSLCYSRYKLTVMRTAIGLRGYNNGSSGTFAEGKPSHTWSMQDHQFFGLGFLVLCTCVGAASVSRSLLSRPGVFVVVGSIESVAGSTAVGVRVMGISEGLNPGPQHRSLTPYP
uniref:Uncharacterized protein n=1 Tax=Timema cristinae TaxID=61476 RepID=A0A7R9H7R7_TIMCR|nr:unnamed protein product [Timema cristinae]